MAQKIIFLLTKDGPLRKSLGLNYRMHYYGPYSEEVVGESENLTTFGLLEEIPVEFPDSTRYDLRLTSEGRKRAKELYEDLDKESKVKLDKLATEAARLNQMFLDRVIEKAYEQADKEGLF